MKMMKMMNILSILKKFFYFKFIFYKKDKFMGSEINCIWMINKEEKMMKIIKLDNQKWMQNWEECFKNNVGFNKII